MSGADVELIDLDDDDPGSRQRRSELTGQLVFQPPNVSGWRPNEYWLTASGLSGRSRDRHQGRRLRALEPWRHAAVVRRHRRPGGGDDGRLLRHRLAGVEPTRAAIVAGFGAGGSAFPAGDAGARRDLLMMVMLSPECHIA